MPTLASSTSLNFFAAVLSAELVVYSLTDLSLQFGGAPPVAGIGGHTAVQVGRTVKGTSVAVKRSRAKHIQSVDTHFAQATLELRILTHKRLRQHPHIVDILGLCVEPMAPELDAHWHVSFSVVLEYSLLGNLAFFLQQNRPPLAVGARIDLARQVSCGLNILHDLGICHGDVKMQNVLVFKKEDGSFVAKVSDFGASMVALQDDPEARVQCPYGTPLLNAPEVRNPSVTRRHFDIRAALRTDMFSFGLLLWEVIKNGRSFFDETWLGGGSSHQRIQQAPDIAKMEAILNTLPHNILLSYGHEFLSVVDLEPELRQRMSRVFDACLQDEPSERKQISAIVEMMHTRSNSPA
jgi:serine/threonine protein kinase